MKHIAACSFGKDSLATVITAIKHNEPLDFVIYGEVMFDTEISGEVPEHHDFIYNKAIPKLKEWGVETKVIKEPNGATYCSLFETPITKGVRQGRLRGFPLCGACYINRDLKSRPIQSYCKKLGVFNRYIGIAKDEEERLLRLDGRNEISILEKYGITENDAFEICKKENLLSPIYEFAPRNGCFFCPNAKFQELRHLYDHHKYLWNRMIELQYLPNKATERFNRTMRFTDIDDVFRQEDAQLNLLDPDKKIIPYQVNFKKENVKCQL